MSCKYPFTKQLSSDDCGASCVSMLLQKLCKLKISIGEIKYIIHTNENGSSFLGIKEGLKKLGVSGEVAEAVYSREALSELTEFPLLTQINIKGERHFIVLYGRKNNKLIIGDPLKTKVTYISVDKFFSQWIPHIFFVTDICKTPLYEFYMSHKEDNVIKKALASQKYKIIISWILSVFTYFAGLISTLMFSLYFDTIIPMKMVSGILMVTMVFTAVAVVQFILNFIYSKISLKVNNSVDLKLTDYLTESVFKKNHIVLESFKNGELITRMRSVSQIRAHYIYLLQTLPIDILTIILTFLILITTNVTLSLLVFIPILIFILQVYLSHEKMRQKSIDLYNQDEKVNVALVNSISNLETIKNYSASDFYQNQMISKLANLQKVSESFSVFTMLQSNIKNVVLSLFTLFTFAIGAYFVIDGKLANGILLAFNSLSIQVVNPFMKIANMQVTYEQGKIAQLRYDDVLKTQAYRMQGEQQLSKINNIEVKDLSFRYAEGSNILQEVFWKAQAGTSTAIIGDSGSGKTTFAKLLANYYETASGVINYNGTDIREYDGEEIRKKVLYVGQNADVFSDTILNNILLGRDIPVSVIKEKAEKIGFDKIIAMLPLGYDTVIGENGLRLSMGQLQLLNILRATLTGYDVIIFDEVTNGLDRHIRSQVKKYLFDYGSIKIFITHDMNFAYSCDYVYRIENKQMRQKFTDTDKNMDL